MEVFRPNALIKSNLFDVLQPSLGYRCQTWLMQNRQPKITGLVVENQERLEKHLDDSLSSNLKSKMNFNKLPGQAS